MLIKIYTLATDDVGGIASRVYATEEEANKALLDWVESNETEFAVWAAKRRLDGKDANLMEYACALKDPMNSFTIDTHNLEVPDPPLAEVWSRCTDDGYIGVLYGAEDIVSRIVDGGGHGSTVPEEHLVKLAETWIKEEGPGIEDAMCSLMWSNMPDYDDLVAIYQKRLTGATP